MQQRKNKSPQKREFTLKKSSKQYKSEPKIKSKRSIDKSSNTTLPKLKLNTKVMPIEKSLIFLGWNTNRCSSVLPVIKQRRMSTIQPVKYLKKKTHKRFQTDRDDNSQDSRTEQKSKQLIDSKSVINKQILINPEKRLSQSDIRVQFPNFQEKGRTEPLQIEKQTSRQIKQKSKLKYSNRYKNKSFHPIQSTNSTDGHKQKQNKTIFDELKQKEQVFKNNTQSLTQRQNNCHQIPQNRKLPKIPQKQLLSYFIDTYNSLAQGFKLPVEDPDFMVVWGENNLYIGKSQIKDNKRIRQGKGVLLTQHSHFQGYFQNNQKKEGCQLRNNGVYKGCFKNNKRQGKGQFIWFNGEYYNGEWMNNQKHGSGIWTSSCTHSQPDTYIGQWKNGKVDGYGVHTWKSGTNKYEGEFKNFLKEGKGLQKFDNGDKYEGDYCAGKPQGYGEYYWIDGASYKGDFKNGLRQGQGTYIQPNGNKHIGEYRNDCKHGYGQIYYVDESIFKGIFIANKKQGEGQLITKDGQIMKGVWKQGKLLKLLESA